MVSKTQNPSQGQTTDLRRRAEQALRGQPVELAALSPEEAQRLLYELQVHQIELELQNDELRRSQFELEISREKYFDLYDLAPVGYLTLNDQGLILEANLTAATLLGVDRGALAKKPLSRFIAREDQDLYYLHLKRLLETQERQACEIRLVRRDRSQFWAWVESSATLAEDGAILWRAILSDITARKQAEEALRASEAKHRQLAQEKAWLLQEMNHRVGNNLTLLLALIDLTMTNVVAPETQNVLQDFQGRVQSMAEVHHLLNDTQWMPLDLGQLAVQVLHSVLDASSMHGRIRCQVRFSGEPVYVTAKQAFKLALILNELTTNSLKYAFQGRDAGQIEVEIAGEGPWARLVFADDGPGWPADVLAGQRQDVGLDMIQTIIEHEMRGAIVRRNNGGAVLECRFALQTVDTPPAPN